MYKKDRLIAYLVSLVILIVSFIFKDYIFLPYENTYNPSNLLTFFSIILGFQTSSFALLFSSSVVHNLYQIKDIENNRITQKHRLKKYYKESFLSLFLSIVFLIAFDSSNPILKINHYFYEYFICTIPFLIFLNGYILFRTNIFLYKIFIKENHL